MKTNWPNFDIGESVKVFTEVGLMKKPRWLVGRFLDEIPEKKAMVEVSGNKVISDLNRVKKYIKIHYNEDGTCPVLDEFVNKHWDQLKSVVSTSVAQLLGPKAPKLNIDEQEKIISVDSGWISLSPGVIERESFTEFAEHPTWIVSVSVSTSGSRWDPPDVDICDIGNQANVVNAAQLFVNTIWNETNRGYWESAGFYFDQAEF